jgi:hypothetical protein
VVSNTDFGSSVLTNNFDPALLNGWGVRPSDWTLGVGVEQRARAARVAERRLQRDAWFDGFRSPTTRR